MYRRTTLDYATLALLAALGCHWRAHIAAAPSSRVSVQMISDEADAAIDILERRAHGDSVVDAQWQRLYQSDGYRDLARRELGMGRPFTDSAFRDFILSDTLLARAAELRRALDDYRHIDVRQSAERALAYLPNGGTIHSRLYLEIKPRTNSFVYSVPGGRAIFLYVDPATSREAAEHDIVTHELHHIGFAESCQRDTSPPSTPVATARAYAGALGEGLAMLAAAGGPDVDPHAASSAHDRERWRRDYARWPDDLRRVQAFLLDVGDGRLTGDSIAAAAAPFWGDAQGPWYTVGYAVGTTIERARGRETLRRVICDPARLLSTYNDVVRSDSSLGSLPIWDDRLIEMLKGAGIGDRGSDLQGLGTRVTVPYDLAPKPFWSKSLAPDP